MAKEKTSEQVMAENAKTAEAAGTVVTHDGALEAGYFGTVMSVIPNEAHLASSEELRAEIYGAAPVPSAEAKDGPFASVENAKASVVKSTNLATVDGAVVNGNDSPKADSSSGNSGDSAGS